MLRNVGESEAKGLKVIYCEAKGLNDTPHTKTWTERFQRQYESPKTVIFKEK